MTFALGEVASIERKAIQPGDIAKGTAYLGLEHIESGGVILGAKPVDEGELASSKFKFTERHLLYGKLRPYLAKIACPDFQGICSTDILPVLPGARLDRSFLCHFLRQPKMVDYANSRTTGANLPRLSPSALAEFQIPIPPLEEQRRIAAILDKAYDIRRKRQQSIRLTEEIISSTFLEMFGDIPAKKSIYDFGTIRGLVSAQSGKSSNQVLSEIKTDIPVYGGNGINGWATKPLFEENVVVVGRVGQQCGIVHVTDRPAWITDNAIVIRVTDNNKLHPIYIAEALQRSPLRSNVEKLDLPFINQSVILDYPIPLPPLDRQLEFVKIREKICKAKTRLVEDSATSNELFNSLAYRAFRAEL
ncbi:restriction endonuclease subunit S [Geomonas oryzae]|uniref:restriction endonuclease subunit S n=1 Tax=Geomonas oryzae TaxID=2364273 RepID=UPI0013A5C7BD|nr:restriction endonuclease subunit S [Geomonas oryzae]